jgi:hypothetical protein
MDIHNIVSAVAGAALSITAVSAFVIKYVLKSYKYVRLANDATTALSDVCDALVDGKLSSEEIEKLEADVEKFKKDLQG